MKAPLPFLLLALSTLAQAAPPATMSSELVRRYPAEVNQGVCADANALYAISNRQIVKYDKQTGVEVSRWQDEKGGPFLHLNAGLVKDGKLYAAHSNYPHTPMKSSIEIWDVKSLQHIDRHDFGETDGSLTWVTYYNGHWYAGFAHYAKKGGVKGRGPEFSRVVKFDDQWREIQTWKYPPELVKRFGGHSASCGAFDSDGRLYVTGHDANELYVLEFPKEGDLLDWVGTIPIPFGGQAFSWDPADETVVYGISRKNSEIIEVKLRRDAAPASAPPAQSSTTAKELPTRGLCAHRGGLEKDFPENTIPAFQEAVRLGAQMIEFDVWRTKDGALVVIHDRTVDRTTNGRGAVSDLTLEQIKQLDAGIRIGPKFAGTRIPTLEEALDVMPRNVWLNIHIKGSDLTVAEEVTKLLMKKQRLDQSFLACDLDMAAAARKVSGDVMICNLKRRKDPSQHVNETIDSKAQFIQFRDTSMPDQSGFAALKQNGVKINVFKAHSPDELEGLLKMGVDFVLVDNLVSFLPEAQRLGIPPINPAY